jgi:putative RNA 2'-phosphotransferase
VESIRAKGLNKGERHDVHLSPDAATAIKVGQRRGKPVVLKIRAGEMHRAGHIFRRSANNVWLVEFVPKEFIEFPS